jgi:hypothetical protein
MGRPKKRQRSDENGSAVEIGSTTISGKTRRQQNGPAGRDQTSAGLPQDVVSSGVLHNMSVYDSYNWTMHSVNNWELDDSFAQTMPSLTSSRSADSPALLNLPPELQNISHSSHNHSYPLPSITNSGTELLLDPSLPMDIGPGHRTTYPDCACLSTIYLSLNTLSSMGTSFAFPVALHPLREAMQTAHAALHCTHCLTRFITGLQNTQLLGTLLISIAERFSQTLAAINAEASRAEANSETKTFRLADLNTAATHLHTGGLGCAAAFSLDLSPAEWRRLAKKVVKAEVRGASEGNQCCPSLMELIDAMQARQERLHGECAGEESLSGDDGGMVVPRDVRTPGEREHLCQKVVGVAAGMVKAFDWE